MTTLEEVFMALGEQATVRAIWELPKIRDTLFWGQYNKDPTI